MKCCDCPHYKTAYMYNACSLTESEYFHTVDDCTLVKDDGSINYDDDYFKQNKEEIK